ncbi:MAG: DinB family protein [Candidatus Hodarchaeales archaeon]
MERLISTLQKRRKGVNYLLKMISLKIWDWRPHENCRSTVELATHLASSPLMLLKLLKGEITSTDGFNMYEKQQLPLNAEGLVNLYNTSLNKLLTYLEQHLDEARNENILFFYKKEKTSIYHEVFEEIGHEWFHLGQLFTYLRSNGVSVDMGAYYGYKDPDPSLKPN